MGIRKSATRLSTTERDNFLRAVLTLKNTIANPADPASQRISVYDQFVALHLGAINITFGATTNLNMGHQNSAFCPWHRYYLYLFEQALQSVDPTVALPYWDWTDHLGTQNILFQDNFLGPNGTGSFNPGGARSVRSGYFAFNRPGTGGNPTALPAWWPTGLAGWRVRPSLAQGHTDPADPATGNTLQRDLDSFANLATLSQVNACFVHTDFEGTTATTRFRNQLEHGTATHDHHHGWVGGNMGDPASSPNDLIFFLHHCNIDRLWAMWQIDGHGGAAYYPSSGRPPGHNLGDAMWPWVGTATGYSAPNLAPDIVLPNFSGVPVVHPSEALDHRALGYSYDTEAVVGIALDQTGSMLLMTPDPMVVSAPDVSKWEAAKRGVAALLHDCETAYAQKEAFVMAGVETFRTLGANTYTPVFAGVPYGVVKLGGAYSEATFTSAVASMTPGGGTPLAGALLDTETNLVRAPLGGLPAHDTRYLMFFTDGVETASPLLSSVATGQLADTVVFGMGFGNPGDVDYTTIANIVAKGKAAPPLVTSQVYHGENAGEINKFFTNSIAHAIGYTPVIDPIYEVFPGEHVDTPFSVTEADQSFMITVQGFDFNDGNWRVCLILPDGDSCSCDGDCDEESGHDGHDHGKAGGHGAPSAGTHEHEGALVTTNKKNGRITVFLNRNGMDPEDWVGRWKVRIMYRMTLENERMFMATNRERLFPAGARPVRGPVFAQAALPVRSRKPSRILPAIKRPGVAVTPVTGANEPRSDASSVAVNVYARTTLRIGLVVDGKMPVAGRELKFRLEANDIGGAKVVGLGAVGRLVAPGFSVGNAFLDAKAVPLANRKKFVKGSGAERVVDEAAYLAAFEARRPGTLFMRDEAVALSRKGKKGPIEGIIQADVPGVYRLAMQVSGELSRAGGEPEPFSRILNFEVPVGLEVDAAKLEPEWHVAKGVLTVTYQVADKGGNHLSPAQPHTPTLLLDGHPLEARLVNDYSGVYRLEAKAPEIRKEKPFKLELQVRSATAKVRRRGAG